jgi:DNA-binding transcriptional LysR family regulator
MPLIEPVPDLRSLDLLRSVAELGSIRQAALAHGVSQPAASTRLRSLERAFGLELLDRSRGAARLTAIGLAVVQWSEVVLDGTADLLLGVAAARGDERTPLRIVASMTVAEYLVPGWLNRLRAAEPTIAVSLQMGNSEQVVEVVRHRGADVGFIEGPRAPGELASRIVRSDDLLVVVAPSHPWARRRRPLTAFELASTPLVLREVGSGTREVLEAALFSLGLSVSPLVELGSTTAIKAAVATGSGPGVLSRLALEGDLVANRLVAVPTEGVVLERSIRAVWGQDRPPSLLARRLLAEIGDSDGRPLDAG